MNEAILRNRSHMPQLVTAAAPFGAKMGAGKTMVDITDREWEAIQAGAISNNKLTQILNNSDLDKLKQLATPRTPTVMTKGKQAQAKSLLNSGRTPSEVADILGVPLSTLTSSLE